MKDGGPAFPGGIAGEEYGDHKGEPFEHGMTLRDYFAAKALALFADSLWYGTNEKPENPWPWIAEECYRAADAMLAEREKTKEQF